MRFREWLGAVTLLIAVIAAAYVGLWVMLSGGIIQIVDAVQKDPVPGSDIAWGVIRILLAGAAAAVTFYVIGFVGYLVSGVHPRKFGSELRRRR